MNFKTNSGYTLSTTKKDVNILILGATGVGKSTFINAFYNFIKFQSLEEAEKNDFCSLIPSKFTITDDNYELIEICTGNDENEIHDAGQSATQSPKVYSFIGDDTRIRLIDTPGIGDTRGIDQDKINFEKILRTLSNFDKLHGICILLKPNDARLDVMFRFCIKELLANLHSTASKNIMFCFTNSRGTFYRPGETLPTLNSLLNENNCVEIALTKKTIYCFDSEAYRFLAALKNKYPPITNLDEDRENFAKSWEKSMFETKRMMEHISKLEPHDTTSTLNLNMVREIIRQLTRPMAEISKNIQSNIESNRVNSKELKKAKDEIEDLKKKSNVQNTELKIIEFDSPKIICTNVYCTKVNSNDSNNIRYCQDECNFKWFKINSVGSKWLLLRRCINIHGNCKLEDCGHSYKEHKQVSFEKKEEIVTAVKDEAIDKLMKCNLSAAEIKQKLIDDNTYENEELEQELKKIEKFSVKFAYFLKKCAISPYNDKMEAYLKHLIEVEEKKINAEGNDAVLEYLKNRIQTYKLEVEIMEKEMLDGEIKNTEFTISEINQLIDELCKLKHSGKYLKDSWNAWKVTQNNAAACQELVVCSRENQNKISSWLHTIIKLF